MDFRPIKTGETPETFDVMAPMRDGERRFGVLTNKGGGHWSIRLDLGTQQGEKDERAGMELNLTGETVEEVLKLLGEKVQTLDEVQGHHTYSLAYVTMVNLRTFAQKTGAQSEVLRATVESIAEFAADNVEDENVEKFFDVIMENMKTHALAHRTKQDIKNQIEAALESLLDPDSEVDDSTPVTH